MSESYQELEFHRMVDDAKLHDWPNSNCPLLEDEAIIWASDEIKQLRIRVASLEEKCKLHNIPTGVMIYE